jgi:radical SAM superfamily enzyme YgiQ (UPF0313 family)
MMIIVNPPNPPGKISDKDTMGGLGQLYEGDASLVPPLDMPLVAACLMQNGVEVEVIDCLGLKYDASKLMEQIASATSGCNDVRFAIRTSLPTFLFDVSIAEDIKAEFPFPIIFFGAYVTLTPEKVLRHNCIDAVILGDPERALVEICLKGIEKAEGVCFINSTGQLTTNDGTDLTADLNHLPLPAWHLMPFKKYFLRGRMFPEDKPFLPVQSSRGCPFACHYCPYPVYQGRKWRSRSAAHVVNELKYIVLQLEIDNILFRDPEFTLNHERVVELCAGIRQADLEFNWRCETRVDTLDKMLLDKMRKAGCIGINIGIETTSAETARVSGRKAIPIDQIKSVIQYCRSIDIALFCFFIIGLPGQDKSEILKLIRLAEELDPDAVQFTFATPYPGTQLEQWAEKCGYIKDREFQNYTGYHPVMRNDYLALWQLNSLMRYAQHRLHMRPRLCKNRIQKSGWSQYAIELIKSAVLKTERLYVSLI